MAFKIWHLSFGYSHPPPAWSLSTFMFYFSLNIDSTWEKNAMFGFSQSVILLYRMVSSSIYSFCKQHKLFLHYLGNAIEMHVFSPQGLRVKTNLHLKKNCKEAPGSAVLETKASSQGCTSCWKLLPAGTASCLSALPLQTSQSQNNVKLHSDHPEWGTGPLLFRNKNAAGHPLGVATHLFAEAKFFALPKYFGLCAFFSWDPRHIFNG